MAWEFPSLVQSKIKCQEHVGRYSTLSLPSVKWAFIRLENIFQNLDKYHIATDSYFIEYVVQHIYTISYHDWENGGLLYLFSSRQPSLIFPKLR